jgi:segregation and condensation protein A
MSKAGENQEVADSIDRIERRRLSEPPIDVLFNPSLILKRDAWNIDVASMLRMLLNILERVQNKDLRICGVAALSSSMIHRIKVESIFKLQTLSEKKSKPLSRAVEIPIENLNPIAIPFRYESSYPVSLQELLSVLESMVSTLTETGTRKSRINLEPVENFSFDQYFVKIEEILAQFEAMIRSRLIERKNELFSNLIADMDPLSSARCFLAMLYLALKGIIQIEETSDGNDIHLCMVLHGSPSAQC